MAIDGLSSITSQSVAQGLVLVAKTDFSAASTVSINNCFSSSYDFYRVMLHCTTASGTQGIRMRLRASAADNSTSNHYYQNQQSRNTTVSSNELTATTNMFIGAADTNGGWISLDLFRPALAAVKYYAATSGYNMTTPYQQATSGVMNVATAFDGLTVYPDASTISGTVRVFGYRNNV